MKFKTFAIAVTAFSVAASMNIASAVDGRINFTGTILANSCTVSSVAGNASTEGSVDFGQVNSATLSSPGDSTVSTPFSIELTDCATTSSANIAFVGSAVTTDAYTTLFESGTPGVGIRITDASTGNQYTPSASSANSGFSNISSGSATGNFNAYLVAYNSEDKNGEVDSSVTFTITYQ